MGFIVSIFNLLIYQPLFNALIFLYYHLPGQDLGVAIIILTVLIKLILWPLSSKGIKAQKALQDVQPKIKELQERFKNDKERQVKEIMELYKKEKVNPFSSILPLLVQLPILIGLFRVFGKGLGPEQLEKLYGFIPDPGQINTMFLGIVDLAEGPTRIIENGSEQTVFLWPAIAIIILAGVFQFIQAKMLSPRKIKAGASDFSQMLQKQMTYFFPLFTVFILWFVIPVLALALYWLTITIFTICHQYITLKKHDPGKSGEN
jgi:YidC/Oxa1 family membrane protein insertase